MASRVQNRRRVSDNQTSFAGGINTVSDDLALLPSQFREGINARLTEYGAVTKRNGTKQLSTYSLSNNPDAVILGGFTWFKDSGSPEAMVVSNGKLWTANTDTVAISGWTAHTVSGNISTTQFNSFGKFYDGSADVVYIADGGKLLRWDGTTLTRDTHPSAPSVNSIRVHNQRLWAVGSSTAPDSLFYSKLNDGQSVGHNGGGNIIVRTFGDERLVALASCGSSLLIFHRRGLSRLTGFGQDDTNVDPEGISSQTGTVARRSIVEIDGAVMFLSDRGTFIATESSVTPVSTGDQPDPLLPLLRTLTESQLDSVCGVLSRDRQEVWFFIPGYGVYAYNLILRAWTGPWNGLFLNAEVMWQSPLGTSAALGVMFATRIDATHSNVQYADFPTYFRDSENAVAVAFPLKVRLRRLYFGNDAVSKAFRFGYLSVTLPMGDSIAVEWRSNIGSYLGASFTLPSGSKWGVGTWGSGTWGISMVSQNERIEMDGYGYYLDVIFTHNNSNGLPVISRWQVDGFALGRR